ncbi:MAG TPA: hypothetical protein PLW99_00650 [Candidatus Paceibacterota bacterium]|nr:MAG: hypothetical protein B7X03_00330 [Parcubacteria group bacterium 21-58-10]OYV83281.1 MAG: hypothetical protein B7W96_00070 [Parcubacteria group bacterium 37-58-5]HQT82643.1 hypothetical protein [Candidatus Paceibacterota bacterium]
MNKNKTLEAVWGALCGNSSIDQETNNISLYNVLERVIFTKNKGENKTPKGPDVAPLQYEYIVLLQRPDPVDKKATYPLTLRIRDPKGVVLNEAPIPAVFDVDKKRLRIRIQNNAFVISGSGEYRFEALLEGTDTPLTSTPLEVVLN